MTIMANHPFALRSLNVRDENGNEGCAVCGRTRTVHPPARPSPGDGYTWTYAADQPNGADAPTERKES